MTRRRWIADQVEGDRAILLGQNAHHLARVLRAKVGQEFAIVCQDQAGGDRVRLGRIATIAEERVVFDLGETVEQAESRHVTLLLAVFKFDRMEWAIEKATELGVTAIQPVIARRTDAHLATAAGKRVERWRRIVHEAAQQSRRVSAPEVAEPLKLKDALVVEGMKIVLAETDADFSLGEVLAKCGDGGIVLAVGPEGGWAEDEMEQFRGAGWATASLGPTVLRAETAAIAGLAIVLAAPVFPQKQGSLPDFQ
ncbi:MAG: RsmE family RNA methyltransferase [Terriglobales bacterium]